MKKSIPLLLAAQFVPVFCQPHHPPSDLAPPIESLIDPSITQGCEGIFQVRVLETRDEEDQRAKLFARATTESTDSTTSTSETSTSTSTSESTTTTSTTSSTSTTTSESTTTTSSSTTESTSTTSTTSSTSSTSTSTSTTSTSNTSSSTTTSTTSTTTSTATSTSTESAAVKEYNRKGKIAAIVFSCCLISLFLGISIIHCARSRAKSKRIAARELLKASAVSAEPLSHSKSNSTANLIPENSSMALKESPFSDSTPRDITAQGMSPMHQNNSQRSLGEAGVTGGHGTSRENVSVPHDDHQRESLV